MNNLITLSIITAILAFLSYKIVKREIFSCAFITLTSFLIGSILLYFQSLVWGIEINNKALWILSIGMISLTAGDIAGYKLYSKKKNRDMPINSLYISIKYCNILIAVYCLGAILYAWSIYKMGLSIGHSDLTAIGEVKENIFELKGYMNPIVRQMYKVVTASSYIHSLIFANNVFLCKIKWHKELKHLIPFICTIVITLASGGRLNIFKVLIGFILITYIILRESSQWKNYFLLKIIKVSIPLIVSFTLLFSAVGIIVKSGSETRAKIESLEYISYYAGSPIQVFSLRIKDGIEKWSYSRFGNYTFRGVYEIFGMGEDIKSKKLGDGMIYLGGVSNKAGNAHTIFGGAYFDFGICGMILFMFISYFIFSRYYYKYIFNTNSSYNRNKRLVIYTYCYTSIIVLAFYDNCYWILFSTTGLLTLLVLLIMYWFYFKKLIIKKYLHNK